MKPAAFEYHAPASVDEVVRLLSRYGDDAKLLAGGQSLVPMMNLRLARPAVLIDLGRVASLDYIQESDGYVAIGAMTRQRTAELSETVRQHAPLLARTLPLVGHAATRNRGTIGGSIAHADPAAELPAVTVALEADLVVVGPRGRRTCKAEGFFVSYLTTSLGSGEVLVELRLPRATADARSAFREFSRRYGDFAIVGVAAALRIDGGGKCQSARLAVIGVGSRPVRVVSAEGVLAGEILTDGVIREAGEVAAKEVEARGDLHASSHYRRRLTAVLIEQAVTDAIQR